MYDNQKPLRRAARIALEAQGYTDIQIIRGSGGARLTCRKNGASVRVMVRTSTDRWMGWMRTDTGAWKGLDKHDLVVVSALSGLTKADVYALSPKTVRDALDTNLAARSKNGLRSATAPIFVSIDPAPVNRPSSVGGNLQGRAEWAETVPLNDTDTAVAVPAASAPSPAGSVTGDKGFMERVRKEFAELTGVAPQQVTVTFEVRP